MDYYLSRDKIESWETIHLWNHKPEFIDGAYHIYKNRVFKFCYGFCRKDFEKITGIHLKPGELRKVKSIKIKLEE